MALAEKLPNDTSTFLEKHQELRKQKNVLYKATRLENELRLMMGMIMMMKMP